MEEKDQNYLFSRFLNVAGLLFSKTLDESDMITLYQAKKLLKASSFVYDNATKFLSENNAANAIFLAINLAMITYQYIYASWFLYLVTTISGVKKLYKMVLQNPILGIFFYISFYFRFLQESDKEKFNLIANAFDLPSYQDMAGQEVLMESMNRISLKLSGETLAEYGVEIRNIISQVFSEDIEKYKDVVTNITYKVFSENVVPSTIEKFPEILENVLEYVMKQKQITQIKNPAIYVKDRTIETQRDLDEFVDFMTKHRREIMKDVREKSRKNKKKRKLILQKVLQKKENGDVICLDVCKPRIKTAMGCYCEGDCGQTLFLGNSSWCYVDPDKCKKGRYLDKYLGKTYDKCNPKKVETKCFTGLGYQNCKIVEK